MKCQRENCDHEATVKYSSDLLSLTHGGGTDICQCCYVKEVETGLKSVQSNLKKQKAILKKKGCK